MKKILSITILFLLIFSKGLYGKDNTKMLFYNIDLKKEVGSTTWIYIKEGFNQAKALKADEIIISMNTYGGEVVYADSIRTKILHSKIPVTVFIDNNAASAGALISIAADKIYMRGSGTIGAASVVDQTGKKMPDKYQSYMRATMRATAEYHGKDTIVNKNDTVYRWKRDPKIAEAMVDERTYIEGIIDSMQVLTFTTEEALKYGFCDAMAENIDDVMKTEANGKEYELKSFQPDTWDNIKGFMTSPYLQSVLIMLIIGGLYFELQSPGVGFALLVSVVAAILYFSPLYIDGLAESWEVILFVIGVILVLLEIFVIPGIGIAGISGTILIIVGLTLSLIHNVEFDFAPVKIGNMSTAFLTVISGVVFGFILTLYISSKIGRNGFLRKLALNTKLEKEQGYVSSPKEHSSLIGKSGTAHTDLRPSGKVMIDDEVYDAVSANGIYIEKGSSITVKRHESGQIYVV